MPPHAKRLMTYNPYYTAAHIEAALAVRAGETDVKAHHVVAYKLDPASCETHPSVLTLTNKDFKRIDFGLGVSIEAFGAKKLGTVQIGGVANVVIDPDILSDEKITEPLACGTLLYAKSDGSGDDDTLYTSAGTVLTIIDKAPFKDKGLYPVARVHHHELHSNIVQARLLHGLQPKQKTDKGDDCRDPPKITYDANFADVYAEHMDTGAEATPRGMRAFGASMAHIESAARKNRTDSALHTAMFGPISE